ncbi:arrestin domain-containing protein 1a [Chanos chanos]|uniref:Arrestin domain-containing protein 1a n=1 Tax=Chanos chanos TaxID=29144 RepID=A0A6J2WSX5_CHACN|nr:arrestin domain-containing protein 1-like [Chanos chanos]
MGKLQAFEISLTDNKLVYSPGESISGTVKITTAQDIQCKAIKVNCNGICVVSSKANDTDWAEEEQYFNSTISVADRGTLKQGEHTFPFKFLIPATAPTSFEGPFGRTIYRIRAYVDTPRFSKDYRAEKAFFMLKPLNLNDIPDILGISESSVTKNFSYMLMKNGTVILKAKSDLKGYVPGQVIKVWAEIDNQSGKSTGHVVASLMQKVTYRTKRPVQDLRAIAEVEGRTVKGGKKAEWAEQIIVPPLPQSPLEGCTLISIEYFIQVSLKYPETLITLPIHIGDIAVDTTRPAPSRHAPPTPAPRVPASSPNPTSGSGSGSGSGSSPSLPPRPAPKPRPRSYHASPSAPPAELPRVEASGTRNETVPNKSHSQRGASGPLTPNAFSYTPGAFPAAPRPGNASAPQFSVSTGATIPFFAEGNATPVPPDYRSSAYPHEPPPSYEESFTNT